MAIFQRSSVYSSQAIKAAIVALGGDPSYCPTRGDAPAYSDLQRCIRAANVVCKGGRPANLNRELKGGVTILSVLVEAGVIV